MKYKDKRNQLLRILYSHRFDGTIYDVQKTLNQLVPINRDEAYNLAKGLEDEGLIRMTATKDSVGAQIISYGVEFVEDQDMDGESYRPADSLDFDERDSIKERLDEFADRLKKMEVGQQITYDDLMEELETLKKLLNVLGKKDWTQILKGKLVDAGFGEIASQVSDLLIDTFKDDKLLNG
jgi:hypothetical protein